MYRKIIKVVWSLFLLLNISCQQATINGNKQVNEVEVKKQDSLIIDSLSIELSDVFTPQTSVSRQYHKQLFELLGPSIFHEANNNRNWQSIRYNEEYIWGLFYDKKQIIYGRSFTIVMLKLSSNKLSVALVDSLGEPHYYGEDSIIPKKLTFEVENLINTKL